MYGARVLYEQPPITSPFEPGTGKGMLRPEDVTSHDLPVGMRGYDREHVERFLHRVSEAYLLTWRQALALRERLRLLEEELAEVHGEAEVSSKAVSELVQRCSTAEDELTQARSAHAELAAKVELAETARKKAVDSHAELAAKVELAESARKKAVDSHAELAARAELAESEREKAVAEVRELTARAAEMEKRLEERRPLRPQGTRFASCRPTPTPRPKLPTCWWRLRVQPRTCASGREGERCARWSRHVRGQP